MYKELVSDIEGFQHPGHGDLTGWAKQGIFFESSLFNVELKITVTVTQLESCWSLTDLPSSPSVTSPVRCVAAQRCVDRPSTPGQLSQRQRLGDVHRRRGAVAQQQPGRPRLHAVGVICSEERSRY